MLLAFLTTPLLKVLKTKAQKPVPEFAHLSPYELFDRIYADLVLHMCPSGPSLQWETSNNLYAILHTYKKTLLTIQDKNKASYRINLKDGFMIIATMIISDDKKTSDQYIDLVLEKDSVLVRQVDLRHIFSAQ